jgi:DNA adenine methylase
MPRYNNSGEFNNAFHVTRDGIIPESLKAILLDWQKLLLENDVEFISQDYNNIQTTSEDLLYLDPPYFNTKGMYYGKIDYEDFWNWLRKQNAKYFLSFDGKTTSVDSTQIIPPDVYTHHEYLYAGNSSFRRIIGKSNSEYVHESLYTR